MNLTSFIEKSNLGKNKLFIAWNLGFYDIRVTFYLSNDLLDLEQFEKIASNVQKQLIQGESSTANKSNFTDKEDFLLSTSKLS